MNRIPRWCAARLVFAFLGGGCSGTRDAITVVKEANAQAPRMVSQGIRLDGAKTDADSKKITFNYTLVAFRASEIDFNALDRIITPMITQYIQRAERQEARGLNDLAVDFRYLDKDGTFITDIEETTEATSSSASGSIGGSTSPPSPPP